MKKQAWIRVDANNIIGRGHLSRCIALAEMIRADFRVNFLIKAQNKSYCQSLLKDWNVNYVKDDRAIKANLSKEDLIIVDSYEIDNAWRSSIKPLVHTLVDINDIPGEIRGASVVLNHCPGMTSTNYITDNDTKLLLGLDYAILRESFLAYARTQMPANQGEGVFICFGGADPYNLSIAAVNALLKGGFKDPIYLVCKADDDLLRPFLGESNIFILHDLSSEEMLAYMLRARLLILSASILSLEAIALRKPILALYYVDNQEFIYNGLVSQGMAQGLGYVNSASQLEGLYETVHDLYTKVTTLHNIKKRQEMGLDGKSGERIRKILLDK